MSPKSPFRHLVGTDEELDAKLKNSDRDAEVQREKLSGEKKKVAVLEEELIAARKQHTDLAKKQGTFNAEFEVRTGQCKARFG
jgi:hypothetical protein